MGILSNESQLKYLKSEVIWNDDDIVDILSDLKHRIFPRPFERLAFSRSESLVGCEIGVCGGEHSLSLLKTLNLKKLYLIDPYEIYSDYSEGIKHYGKSQDDLGITHQRARDLLSEFKDTIEWIHEYSSNAVGKIAEELDFVYIDGNHQYDYVYDDLKKYFPLVKSGGIIGGHDFYNGFQRDHDGVVESVVDWYSANKDKVSQLRVELPDWWMKKK